MALHTSSTLLPKPATSCRHVCWRIVDGGGRWWVSTLFEASVMTLIFANVVLVIVDTEPEFDVRGDDSPFNSFYTKFEIGSLVVFAVEYALRLWCCIEAPNYRGRLRWALQPLALVDLFSMVPFVVDLAMRHNDAARGFTLVRLLRTFSLLRLERSFQSFKRIANVLNKKGEELVVTAFMAVILLTMSSSLMYYLEDSDEFPSIAGSAWWSAAALTTTGYGDLTPKSAAGRILAGVVGFVGVVFVALPAGIIGSGFVEVMLEEKKRREDAGLPHDGPAAPVSTAAVQPLISAAPAARDTGGGGAQIHPPAAADEAPSSLEVPMLLQVRRAIVAQQPMLAAALVDERLRSLGVQPPLPALH